MGGGGVRFFVHAPNARALFLAQRQEPKEGMRFLHNNGPHPHDGGRRGWFGHRESVGGMNRCDDHARGEGGVFHRNGDEAVNDERL